MPLLSSLRDSIQIQRADSSLPTTPSPARTPRPWLLAVCPGRRTADIVRSWLGGLMRRLGLQRQGNGHGPCWQRPVERKLSGAARATRSWSVSLQFVGSSKGREHRGQECPMLGADRKHWTNQSPTPLQERLAGIPCCAAQEHPANHQTVPAPGSPPYVFHRWACETGSSGDAGRH